MNVLPTPFLSAILSLVVAWRLLPISETPEPPRAVEDELALLKSVLESQARVSALCTKALELPRAQDSLTSRVLWCLIGWTAGVLVTFLCLRRGGGQATATATVEHRVLAAPPRAALALADDSSGVVSVVGDPVPGRRGRIIQ